MISRPVQTNLDNVQDCVDEFEKIKNEELPKMEQTYRSASQDSALSLSRHLNVVFSHCAIRIILRDFFLFCQKISEKNVTER